jgi:hypothetical protein
MSNKIMKLLERLAEMFPKQDYQSKLEQYIKSKNAQSVAEVEALIKEYDRKAWQ